MSDPVKLQLIITSGLTIVSIVNLWLTNRVRHQTNSIKDELVASTKKASHAEGMKDQRDSDAVRVG